MTTATKTTTKHTAEPWTITTEGGELYICDQHDALLMRVGPVGSRDKEDHWNAERAVACVNACAGIEGPRAAINLARASLATVLECWDKDQALRNMIAPVLRALGG